MKVDPSGLADAARRITAALAQLPTADPVHPALAGDVTSQGAAARLTSGGATLAALIGELASGLAATADGLAGGAAGLRAGAHRRRAGRCRPRLRRHRSRHPRQSVDTVERGVLGAGHRVRAAP